MITAILLSITVAILAYFGAPWIVRHFGGETKKYRVWLLIGILLYTVSWWLPSPLIEGKNTNFTTHFLGGGIFTGMIWYYFKQSLKWKALWLLEAVSLYVFVSALGVANELFEVVLYMFGGMPNGIADTSWDLLANTLGALLFYVVYLFLNQRRR